MVLSVILRGFKIPVTLLGQFLGANGHPPLSAEGELDTKPAFLRAKLAGTGRTSDDTKARLFIPRTVRS